MSPEVFLVEKEVRLHLAAAREDGKAEGADVGIADRNEHAPFAADEAIGALWCRLAGGEPECKGRVGIDDVEGREVGLRLQREPAMEEKLGR